MTKLFSWRPLPSVVLFFILAVVLWGCLSYWSSSLAEISMDDVREIGRPHEDYASIESRFGYNVGDLLNMPSFVAAYRATWPLNGRRELVEIATAIHLSHPKSIIGRYFQNYTCCQERLPLISRLKKVVASYGEGVDVSLQGYLRSTIESQGTLLIHVRSCDKSVPHNNFLNYAASLSQSFQSIVLMGQCHNDTRYANHLDALENLRRSFQTLVQRIGREKVTLFPRANADDHLFAMSRASHLLVHRGGFSAVGALVCRGRVYYCLDMQPFVENADFMANIPRHQSCRKA